MKDLFSPILVSALISASGAILTAIFSFWYNHVQYRHLRNKIYEDINLVLIKERIETYSVLMKDLKIISSFEIKDLSNEDLKERARNLVTIIQNGIFGKVGLIAGHETREMILRLRAKCKYFQEDKIPFSQVRQAAMEVHQMLRSDLGVPQPGLRDVIQKMRKGEASSNTDHIEQIANRMNHLTW